MRSNIASNFISAFNLFHRIFANLWWMSADMLTYEPMDYPSHYDSRSITARYMMLGGLCWLSFFYLVVKPLKLFDCDNPEILKLFDSSGLEPRWPLFFNKWREYENIQWVLTIILFSSLPYKFCFLTYPICFRRLFSYPSRIHSKFSLSWLLILFLVYFVGSVRILRGTLRSEACGSYSWFRPYWFP